MCHTTAQLPEIRGRVSEAAIIVILWATRVVPRFLETCIFGSWGEITRAGLSLVHGDKAVDISWSVPSFAMQLTAFLLESLYSKRMGQP